MDIDLNKSILIIDEAHNIMQAAESVIDTEISHS
jgi:Rad3-related DNA helicase